MRQEHVVVLINSANYDTGYLSAILLLMIFSELAKTTQKHSFHYIHT